MTEILRLPPQVFDDSISALMGQLAATDSGEKHTISLDFQAVTFYVPAALTTLLATIDRWQKSGHRVEFINLESCPSLGYLQRMDFLALSGVDLPERFRRHDSSGRFLPLRRVDAATRGQVDQVCSEIAACLFPDLAECDDPESTGPFDVLQYASSELINNVLQHAKGCGFVAAQAYPKSGFVRVAVADSGIGIRQSFEETRPEFWDPQMTHLDAVRTALQPKVSSKMHLSGAWGGEPVNAGVGLSMLKEVARHSDGLFTLVSGTGFYQHNHHEKRSLPSELILPHPFGGTLCALQVSQQKLGNLQQILQDSKKGIGLIRTDHRFDRLFE